MSNTSSSRGLGAIPNLFTLLNLVFGCLAIIFILQPGQRIVLLAQDGTTEVNLPEKITWGSLCIFAAAVIDFLDGFVARLFKSTSKMGEQLDSLADLVSFGVAPGLILYQLLRISFAQQEDGLEVSLWWLIPALLIPCSAAWRLAKFNLQEGPQYSFIGLPTPSTGLCVASLPLIIWFGAFGLEKYLINKWVLYIIILFFSYLMISPLRLMSLKFKDFGWQNNWPKYLLVIVSAVALVLLKWMSVPVMVLAYVLISLLPKNKAV